MVPYQEAPSPPMTDELREAAAGALHVLLPDGTIIVGDRAVVYVYEKLGYAVAGVFRLPPLSWVSPLMYSVLANHRRFFARFAFRPRK